MYRLAGYVSAETFANFPRDIKYYESVVNTQQDPVDYVIKDHACVFLLSP